jgi:polysaccharide export outer membrane protein
LVFFRLVFIVGRIAMSRSSIFLSLFIAVVLPLRAAAAADRTSRPESPKEEVVRGGSADYTLQPQDFIRVQVYGEPDLTRELRISHEGEIELPHIGRVDLRRKTLRQAEDMIRKRYDADYLVNPQINLTVLEYAPRTVQVFGMVGTPGVVLFPKEEGLTLTKAISMAGSFTRLANKKLVTLKRAQPDGTTKTYTINVEDLTKGASTEDWPLQPDDVINVPERIL